MLPAGWRCVRCGTPSCVQRWLDFDAPETKFIGQPAPTIRGVGLGGFGPVRDLSRKQTWALELPRPWPRHRSDDSETALDAAIALGLCGLESVGYLPHKRTLDPLRDLLRSPLLGAALALHDAWCLPQHKREESVAIFCLQARVRDMAMQACTWVGRTCAVGGLTTQSVADRLLGLATGVLFEATGCHTDLTTVLLVRRTTWRKDTWSTGQYMANKTSCDRGARLFTTFSHIGKRLFCPANRMRSSHPDRGSTSFRCRSVVSRT